MNRTALVYLQETKQWRALGNRLINKDFMSAHSGFKWNEVAMEAIF